MSHVLQPHRRTSPIQGVARSAACFLRWLLVLLLALDQVGSSLHRHHHDSGVDGSAIHTHHVDSQPIGAHIEDDDEPSLFHSITALRAGSRTFDPDSSSSGQADTEPPAMGAARALPCPRVEPCGKPSWAAPAAPPHPIHRSLPPAGRAPPSHA